MSNRLVYRLIEFFVENGRGFAICDEKNDVSVARPVTAAFAEEQLVGVLQAFLCVRTACFKKTSGQIQFHIIRDTRSK